MSFLPQELIRKKRDGKALTFEEIAFIVEGLTKGTMSDEQIGAFAMAVFFQGMSLEERIALTSAMRDSGSRLDWRAQDLGKPVVDKHSTGGVGDKISLMLAPLVAACGAAVPMISGRGLGHTGGTLDKLGAIPGYDAFPSPETFVRVTKEIGCAIIGQTSAMAPADKKLYAIRDVTATVESIPLITASILSKKLAAGLDALVMDVKFGSGAFVTTLDEARELAESIVTVAKGAGCGARALITDMNEVLGTSAGNAVEVVEAIDYLTGKRRDARLHEITSALAAEMLLVTKSAPSVSEAETKVKAALDSGAAAEVFARMVSALGGPANLLEAPNQYLPLPERSVDVFASRAGVVTSIDVREIGLAIVALGGGRTRSTDSIDSSVGITEIVGLGAAVGPGRPLARVHVRNEAQAEQAASTLRAAFHIGDTPPAPRPILADRLM